MQNEGIFHDIYQLWSTSWCIFKCNLKFKSSRVYIKIAKKKKKRILKGMKTISKKRKKKLLNVQVTLLLLQLSSDDAVCIIILEFLIYIIYENVETTFI